MSRIRSVNVGRPQPVDYSSIGRSSIRRMPVDGPVWVGPLGLEGDEVSDRRHHGGVDQAVHAFAREEMDHWAAELGGEVPDGLFGENLTTSGVVVDDAVLGERWRIGDCLLEVCSTRIPCRTFAGRMAEVGLDARRWVKRFSEHGRAGAYLRVIEEGALQVGDEVRIEHRPDHGITTRVMFRAITTQPELLPELLVVDNLVEEARRNAERYLARR